MEFLRSILRRHFAGKPVVASRNVGEFSQANLVDFFFEFGFNIPLVVKLLTITWYLQIEVYVLFFTHFILR